jgi:hypothetical protein
MPISLTAVPTKISSGGLIRLEADPADLSIYEWQVEAGRIVEPPVARNPDYWDTPVVHWDTTGVAVGGYRARVTDPDNRDTDTVDVSVRVAPVQEPIQVDLLRTDSGRTNSQALWAAIHNSTAALEFDQYNRFIDLVLCESTPEGKAGRKETKSLGKRRALPYPGVDAYRVLKLATEAFIQINCGVVIDPADLGAPFDLLDFADERNRFNDPDLTPADIEQAWNALMQPVPQDTTLSTLPYFVAVLNNLRGAIVGQGHFLDFPCDAILQEKLTRPCLLELIWSYWHEEGMLVQTLNAISLRFQNRHGAAEQDPLANLEIDPLRPLTNLLWGYIQDEQHRLSVIRRAYEYDHHYGISLYGRAVPEMRTADSRSKFLEAFHTLLNLCAAFFKEDDDTTVFADGFPVLNGLKEVHLLLTEGQHNQYGDLPSTARQEMLIQQWLLARPEIREFLPIRPSVAYPEPWMGAVDSMKRLQGWTDSSIMHFRDLGVFGERILLSVRYGNWNAVFDPREAANWARYWRAEIQSYIYGYQVLTGVDLTAEPVRGRIDATMPTVHLSRRLAEQLRSRQPVAIRGPSQVPIESQLVRPHVREIAPQRQLPPSRR